MSDGDDETDCHIETIDGRIILYSIFSNLLSFLWWNSCWNIVTNDPGLLTGYANE